MQFKITGNSYNYVVIKINARIKKVVKLQHLIYWYKVLIIIVLRVGIHYTGDHPIIAKLKSQKVWVLLTVLWVLQTESVDTVKHQ